MNEYKINVQFDEKSFNFLCLEDQDIISVAKTNEIELLSSGCSGVSTSCASMVVDRLLEQENARALNNDLRENGFAPIFVAYPKSDLQILIGDEFEDNFFNDQFGRDQK